MQEEEPFEWLDEEGAVVVEEALLGKLQAEVDECVTKSADWKSRGTMPCPLCPFRTFHRRDHWERHARRYHSRRQQYCCSGTKQLSIVIALHDADQLHRRRGRNYLQRSADVLRRSVRPALSAKCNAIDKHIRLLLDGSGPKVVHAEYLKAGVTARRVGRLWYTHSFAEQVWQEMLLHHGKAGATRHAVSLFKARSRLYCKSNMSLTVTPCRCPGGSAAASTTGEGIERRQPHRNALTNTCQCMVGPLWKIFFHRPHAKVSGPICWRKQLRMVNVPTCPWMAPSRFACR